MKFPVRRLIWEWASSAKERRWADGWAGIECLYKWMDGGDNGGACLEPVGALWQCHISSSGSPAHTQPSTIHHTDHTQHCTKGRDVKKISFMWILDLRYGDWYDILSLSVSRSWRKLGVSFSPSSRLVMVGLYSLPTQAALTGQCFF